MKPMFVATLATKLALNDLRIFLKTISLWSTDEFPTIYLFADSAVISAIPSFAYAGKIISKDVLNIYSQYNRAQMERIPGKLYPSLWFEFQAEKLALLQWVFDSESTATDAGVFYFDADICFLGPLPTIPIGSNVGLSPHNIRETDEAKYGRYNAGYIWMKTSLAIEAWRQGCKTSRFFEQAALEYFDTDSWTEGGVYKFPIQHNYGWWRLWQGRKPADEQKKEWSIFRNSAHSGILVNREPLCSVHTHWLDGGDHAVKEFNMFILNFLNKLSGKTQTARLLIQTLSHKI